MQRRNPETHWVNVRASSLGLVLWVPVKIKFWGQSTDLFTVISLGPTIPPTPKCRFIQFVRPTALPPVGIKHTDMTGLWLDAKFASHLATKKPKLPLYHPTSGLYQSLKLSMIWVVLLFQQSFLNKASEVQAATGLVGGLGVQGHFVGYPSVHEIQVKFLRYWCSTR